MVKNYTEHNIHPQLSEFIECIWFSEHLEDQQYKIIPDHTIELIFTSSPILRTRNGEKCCLKVESHLAGLKTLAQHIEVKKGKLVGVRFKPESFYHFIKADAKYLLNQSIDLDLLFGKGINCLEKKVLELLEYDRHKHEVVSTIEQHLLKSLYKAEQEHKVEEIVKRIHRGNGNIMVSKIALELGCSVKTLERKFTQKIGLAPKAYNRLYRFHQSVLAMDRNTEKLSNIAYDAGYYDQMHFVKEVKKYAAMTPKELFKQKQGFQNPTLTRG